MDAPRSFASTRYVDVAIRRSERLRIEDTWGLLVDIAGWPRWQNNVTATHVVEPVRLGTSFVWTWRGRRHDSIVRRCDPFNAFEWRGNSARGGTEWSWQLHQTSSGLEIEARCRLDGLVALRSPVGVQRVLEAALCYWIDSMVEELAK